MGTAGEWRSHLLGSSSKNERERAKEADQRTEANLGRVHLQNDCRGDCRWREVGDDEKAEDAGPTPSDAVSVVFKTNTVRCSHKDAISSLRSQTDLGLLLVVDVLDDEARPSCLPRLRSGGHGGHPGLSDAHWIRCLWELHVFDEVEDSGLCDGDWGGCL